MWFIYALSTAILVAIHYAAVKKFIKDVDDFTLIGTSDLILAASLFLISYFRGIPDLGPKFYSAVFTTGIINIAAVYFYYKSMRLTDISLAVPMLSFSPAFSLVTSFLVLGEKPEIFGLIGVLLIVTGSYVLNINKDRKGFFAPIRQMFENKGVFFMLLTALLFSISLNYDKLAVLNSDTTFGASVTYFIIATPFVIFSVYKNFFTASAATNNISSTRGIKIYTKNAHKFFLIALPLVFGGILGNMALQLQIVPYVSAIKRMTILFSVLIGAIFFKEKQMQYRFFGAAVMVAGVLFIVL